MLAITPAPDAVPVAPPKSRRSPALAATSNEPPEAAIDLSAETRALARAHRALADGDGARALVVLEQSARKFPHGLLALERRALRIVALCAIDQREKGREEAALLVRDHPDAPYRDRIAKACAEPR